MRPFPAASLPASLLLLAVAASAARAQDEDDHGQRVQRNAFTWEGRVPDGRWLYLRNLNGGVRVEPGAGDRVVVTAEKRWRRGDPASVRVVQQEAADGQGVVVCTVYEGGTCDERDYRSGRSGGRWWGSENNNDVSVSYVVRVPRGVKLDLETTNGGLDVRGAGGEIVGRTTNGGIQIDGGAGPVRAHTTNGGVAVRLSGLAPAGDFDLTTTNGGVSLAVPASLDAEVDMSTTNGGVSTDFPVTVQGRINPRRLQATLGSGGRRVRMRTTNGGVSLRRAD